MPRCFGFNSGLQIGIRPSFPLGDYAKGDDGVWRTPSTPTWFELLSEQDFEKRVAMVNDEAVGAALLAEAGTQEMQAKWGRWAHVTFFQADERLAKYAPYSLDQERNCVEVLAAERGVSAPELWLELNRQQGCLSLFYEPFANKLEDVMEMHLSSNWCLPGVGDTGAHLSIIIDAGWPIFVLSHWHRERGFYSLEEAVHKITSAPAAAAAIHNRGELRVGMRADINLIDLDAVGELKPEMVQVRLPLELACRALGGFCS